MAYGFTIKVQGGGYLQPAVAGNHRTTPNADDGLRHLQEPLAVNHAYDLSRHVKDRTFEVWSLEDKRLCAAYRNGNPTNNRAWGRMPAGVGLARDLRQGMTADECLAMQAEDTAELTRFRAMLDAEIDRADMIAARRAARETRK